MEQVNILYVGRNPEILETVVRLLNKKETWKGCGFLEDELAMQAFSQGDYDIVLLGPGIEEADEQKLRAHCVQENADTIIIQHYGGGSGLLYGEIMQALHEKSK